MKLHPIKSCMERADALIEKNHNVKVYQQFNCANCGAKQTMEEANAFYSHGTCEECGHTTDIEKDGCNMCVMIGIR